jgi:aspartyl-tRNA(Asn)/glutamyl-tRNA(Gln) amidotransferase subunit A
VINPWSNKEQRSAGGSSGGSAAAVAADQCIGYHSQSNAHLRYTHLNQSPWYGYWRFRATSRLILWRCRLQTFLWSIEQVHSMHPILSNPDKFARYGVIAYADSLDCVGILAKKVEQVRDIFGKLQC